MTQRLTYNTNEIYSPEDLVRVYNHYKMGHFFSKETMRFFKSKLTSIFGSKGGAFYFVTSEKASFTDDTRVWTLRKAYIESENGEIQIDTVSEFGEFKTAYQAKKALQNALKA